MNKKKILIVDDEPDVLRLTSLRLEKVGYDTLTAGNAGDALDIIQAEKPDLVLLDTIVPIVYGTEICRRVKSDENLKRIPIVLFTAHSDIMNAEKAKSFGADGYIGKPFDARELVTTVEQILAAPAAL
jgi:two-component system, OmpR family, alkaline phosphatase synthesis response regulator PhoP